MAETLIPTGNKKKLPGWVKLIIVLAILGIGGIIVVGGGIAILANYFSSQGGQELAKRGIEKLIEKGIEQGGVKADVNLDEGGIVIKDDKSGEQVMIGTNQQLPADFPQDIPVYSPSQVTASMKMGPMTMVTFDTTSQVTDVSGYYQQELPGKGWTVILTAAPDPNTFTGLYQKDNRQLTVTATFTTDMGKTSVGLSYGMESIAIPQSP